MNGVFLVALCLSIFLEAIQRFVEPQEVSNPRLVLIVGCFGLASNILGLFLFHEHGHSHGGAGHSHGHGEDTDISVAEEGHSHVHGIRSSAIADESGNVADVLPESIIGDWPKSAAAKGEPQGRKERSRAFNNSDEDDSTAAGTTSPLSMKKSNASQRRHARHGSSNSRSRYASFDDIHVHPASFRNEIIAASRLQNIDSESGTDSEQDNAVDEEEQNPSEQSPLLGPANQRDKSSKDKHTHSNGTGAAPRHDSWHTSHKHRQPETKAGGGEHSHGDLNMRGVFLHVMGDALGNIGVIASALIIWLTDYSWRFYSDPAISLIITVIILGSAIPLCRAAARILLQAVPAGISIDDIKEDIEELPGILSCHHVHVWQLSDTKLVASLHVQVEFDFKGEGSARYMELARAVRHCLHEYGIHSSTIQPEFCLDSEHRHTEDDVPDNSDASCVQTSPKGGRPKVSSKVGSRAASMRSDPDACLLDCGNECDEQKQCCTPTANDSDGHRHDQSHDD